MSQSFSETPRGGRTADLVLEGGGVKGNALVGAIAALEDAGYSFHRLAGTSAGAMVAAVVAAGIPARKLHELMLEVDYSEFLDRTRLGRLHLGRLGDALSEVVRAGLYEGAGLRARMASWLAEAGVTTFGDLRLNDPGLDSSVPDDARFRVVMIASDISRELMVRIPWDLRGQYGIEPSSFSVADAVRMSTAIPFFYTPSMLHSRLTGQDSYMVDGGLTSGFPLHIFDRTDGRPPRWPTFQIGLTAVRHPSEGTPSLTGRLDLVKAVVHTALHGRLNAERVDPELADRIITVDTSYVATTEFTITRETRQRLFDDGYAAMQRHLGQTGAPRR